MSKGGQLLQVEFPTEEDFQREYASNIANGGVFIPCEDPFELNQPVRVELFLSYLGETMVLAGEVVHMVPPGMEATGAYPGVAVQFTTPARELRETLERRFGVEPPSQRDTSPPGRRRAKRSTARLPAHIRTEEGVELNTRTRDLSEGGVLVSAGDEFLPVGLLVRIRLRNPATSEEVETAATVVRHLENDDGIVSAFGLEFCQTDPNHERMQQFVTDVVSIEHSRRLGGINGPIAELGIENLLQMFGTCSPQGTLIVARGAEEGFIAFEGGLLIGAQIGSLRGKEALGKMLSWREGRFEFEAVLAEQIERGEPVSLSAAILDAICSLDESRRDEAELDLEFDLGEMTDDPEEEAETEDGFDMGFDDTDAAAAPEVELDEEVVIDLDDDGGIDVDSIDLTDTDAEDNELVFVDDGVETPLSVDPSTKLRVNAQRVGQGAELTRIEEAVLELATVGMTAGRLADVIPESEEDVYHAIHELLGRGLIDVQE